MPKSVTPQPRPILPERPTVEECRMEIATALLYIFFFLLWCAGLLMGLRAEATMFLGMPLWFSVSCIIAYTATCLALWLALRRRFK